MALRAQKCRQECRDRVITALRAGREGRAENGCRNQLASENVERGPLRRRLLSFFEDRRLRHFGPDVKHQKRGQDADKEQESPGELLVEDLKDYGGNDGGGA